MAFDRHGLEILEPEQCLALLASTPIARIGLSIDALPVVLPVNIVVDDTQIVMRGAHDTKLGRAMHGTVVAVEADDYDVMTHTGWSVLVRGTSRMVQDHDELERLRRLAVTAWIDDDADTWICVAAELISGRRIRRDRVRS